MRSVTAPLLGADLEPVRRRRRDAVEELEVEGDVREVERDVRVDRLVEPFVLGRDLLGLVAAGPLPEQVDAGLEAGRMQAADGVERVLEPLAGDVAAGGAPSAPLRREPLERGAGGEREQRAAAEHRRGQDCRMHGDIAHVATRSSARVGRRVQNCTVWVQNPTRARRAGPDAATRAPP
jgi:hypothetical protein